MAKMNKNVGKNLKLLGKPVPRGVKASAEKMKKLSPTMKKAMEYDKAKERLVSKAGSAAATRAFEKMKSARAAEGKSMQTAKLGTVVKKTSKARKTAESRTRRVTGF